MLIHLPRSPSSSVAPVGLAAVPPAIRARIEALPRAARWSILSFLDVASIVRAQQAYPPFRVRLPEETKTDPVGAFLSALRARMQAVDDRNQAAADYLTAQNQLLTVLSIQPGQPLAELLAAFAGGIFGVGLVGAGILSFDGDNQKVGTGFTILGGGITLVTAIWSIAAFRTRRLINEPVFENFSHAAVGLHLATETVSDAYDAADAQTQRFRGIGTRAAGPAEALSITVVPTNEEPTTANALADDAAASIESKAPIEEVKTAKPQQP